jgi:spoIIIJ-associated protein
MEWVETTANTVDEAVEQALDLLGVDERDAEIQVVNEPKMGLFGKLREEARVRARVRPQNQRPRDERRPAAPPRAADAEQPSSTDGPPEERLPSREVPMPEQVESSVRFVEGLLDAMDIEAEVTGVTVDDDTGEVHVNGTDLGMLIGPKGMTLMAIQDLLRTAVQRKTGIRNGRLYLDIAGYRQKRKDALQRFSSQVATEVKTTGRAAALEPMNAADRKIVHDAINPIDGVQTHSEGEDPHRRVVISPG